MASPSPEGAIGKSAFLSGVFLISFAMLIFQIVQTRILSVIAWYYLAFFAISVAMLGMTVGAVRVYLRREQFRPERLASELSDNALACAIGSMRAPTAAAAPPLDPPEIRVRSQGFFVGP